MLLPRISRAWLAPFQAAALALLLQIALPADVRAQSQSTGQGQNSPNSLNTDQANSSGPVRLRQSAPRSSQGQSRDRNGNNNNYNNSDDDFRMQQAPPRLPREPDEFERFVSGLAGFGPTGKPIEIRRFGTDLMNPDSSAADQAEGLPLVPPDYLVKPGDQLFVAIWGTVDAELDLTVDRSGRISLPRVGSVVVAGIRFADLQELLKRRVAQSFKNFDISVSMGELRGQRVFVTGFVQRPGSYNLTSLSTLSQAVLRAGGPSAAGSFRQITLRRGGQKVGALDLYDVLVKGERKDDRVLQPDDVVNVGPVGVQVGVLGSVNQPAIFELKPGETVRDVLQMAGGLSPVADGRRLTLESLGDRDKLRIIEWPLPESESRSLAQGDVLRAISSVSAIGSQLVQNKRVRVEGEVLRPGTYILPPGSTLADALQVAGGVTTSAYLFGTELQRESVRASQQENYDRALRDMETDFARVSVNARASNAEEAAALSSRSQSTSRLIERLRLLRPSGRVVLGLQPTSRELPALVMEDSDRLYIPPRSTTVGVFGSVYSAGNFLYGEERSLDQYLRLAGGPTRGADRDSIFVIRANGSVVSESQNSGWFSGGKLGAVPALPGDTLFVPEEINKATFVQNIKDWTQILFQFGLSAAAFKSLGL